MITRPFEDKSLWHQGWYMPAIRLDSPNFGPRPEGACIDLLVLHSISLPPGEYGGDQVQRARIGRALEPPGRHQPRQRAVDRILAQPVLEQVHDKAALAVMDVLLVLDPRKGLFGQRIALASGKILIELELQEAADLVLAIQFLHHHQRRILRQRFR